MRADLLLNVYGFIIFATMLLLFDNSQGREDQWQKNTKNPQQQNRQVSIFQSINESEERVREHCPPG